jgi:Fatty acid desaturase
VEAIDIEGYVGRSRALDLTGIDWDEIPRRPLPAEAVRTLRYMQDIETHTIVYLRALLSTRAVDDPEVATFFACWFYEETFHGRALARFLAAAGHEVTPRPRSRMTFAQWLDARGTGLIARAWPDFVGVHMTWGAINELTTLVGYQRLSALAGHPVLSEILARIVRDESRHFWFYFHQAERWLARPRTARIARFLVDRFWAPVGSGVQPACETRFLGQYLLGGEDGRRAARTVDQTIRRLPGFAGVELIEAWFARQVRAPGPRATTEVPSAALAVAPDHL